MTFAAVIKNLVSMYSSCDFERLFICYKAEAMLEKVMPQGYTTSNYTGVGGETTTADKIMIDILVNNGMHVQQRYFKRYIGTRLFEKILPRICQGEKGLREPFAYDYRNQ